MNRGLCDARAVLYQLSCMANGELVVVWINDKLLGDGYVSF